ncbi:MAG: hypothetical protein I3273_04985 [Candidatus Moeniiplasma glomeromycotorum]|nr:hypothetical protein [Candidatus Moeniiplasma glomeromycotorum]MCE8167897.1 hypothetical protein [Candidatus Moeniiplasma glomeromycotorum]MCE8169447.1 hypothetical protein [Candidatus Moeniiplasma glomeromycotorum]
MELETNQTFICSNCGEKKEIKELANTVPVYEDEPIKTCRKCYDIFHNPPKEKPKDKEYFFCDYCRREVFSIRRYRRVSVSEPNEVGMVKGKYYNLCLACDKKVQEYNDADDRDLEKNPYEPWE